MNILKQIILITLIILGVYNQSVSINNYGCNTFYPNGTCQQCSTRYYLDNNGICQPVNAYCNTYNLITGACLTCYSGYQLIQTTCLPSSTPSNQDPNCYQFLNGNCVQCSQGYYFSSGVCTQVSPTCQTWNQQNGQCLTCYGGYSLTNGQCVVSNVPLDPNCNTFVNNVCTKCSQGYYFNSNNVCTQINPNCQTFNIQTATCTQCYQGYSLNSANQCIQNAGNSNNPLCSVFVNNQCTQCSQGSYFNASQICVQINPLCKTFNYTTTTCQGCYNGYTLVNGNCVIGNGGTVDPNCNTFVNNVCVACSYRYYFGSNQKCQLVSPLCNTFNQTNGACITCYTGYSLVNGTCILSSTVSSNPLCASWNGNTCLICAQASYFGPNGLCVAVNPLCNTYNSLNGACLTCYSGYIISGTTCIVANNTQNKDPNCNQYINNVCQQCSNGYYFNQNGTCTLANPQCKTFQTSNGNCLTCYVGYVLINGSCILQTPTNSDINCQKYVGTVCTQCVNQYYVGTNGICQPVNVLCKTYNNTGSCTSCYTGYNLVNGACSLNSSPPPPTPSTIANCIQYSPDGTWCYQCSSNYFPDSKGGCNSTVLLYDGNCVSWVYQICNNCLTGYTPVYGYCTSSS